LRRWSRFDELERLGDRRGAAQALEEQVDQVRAWRTVEDRLQVGVGQWRGGFGAGRHW
jgi:hypothetical protein